MKNLHMLISLLLALVLSLAGCQPSVQKPLTVILVRHAEKVDHSRDPDLSPEGYLRAEALAHTLSDTEISGVHSSDYIRTRETAAPAAAQFNLQTELYDTSDLHALADKLKSLGGRHLVVGHSNTTPELVEILGGEPGPPIEDEWEYDRLYVLSLTQDGVRTLRLRYGKPCSSLPSSIRASSLLVPQTAGSALKSLQTPGLSGRP
jgi:phosphohistidine phosphatase SixA